MLDRQRRREEKRMRKSRGNTKVRGGEEEVLHNGADIPKGTAAHGGPMPEQKRVRSKERQRETTVS